MPDALTTPIADIIKAILNVFDKEVDEMVAWALERTADGAMQAEQFQVFSLVVTQVRQSIERRRERRG